MCQSLFARTLLSARLHPLFALRYLTAPNSADFDKTEPSSIFKTAPALIAFVDKSDDTGFNPPGNPRSGLGIFPQRTYPAAGNHRCPLRTEQADVDPALIAIGVFNLAPNTVGGDDFNRQIFAPIDPFYRKFRAWTGPHSRLGLLNRGPVRSLLLRLTICGCRTQKNTDQGRAVPYEFQSICHYLIPNTDPIRQAIATAQPCCLDVSTKCALLGGCQNSAASNAPKSM